jgi:S1-C subfamily serine protease
MELNFPGQPYPQAGATPPAPAKSPHPLLRVLAAAVTVWLLGLTAALYVSLQNAPSGGTAVLAAGAPIAAVAQPQSAAAGASVNAAAVAAQVAPSVVDINTTFVTGSGSGRAAGTGIIVTSTGDILTNNHVVEGATSITVTIAGRSGTYPAQVLGVDPTADVALIQVDGVSGLPLATIADSSTLQPGEAVVAIGNAGGVGGAPSVSNGTIVALGQAITASGGTTPEQLTGLIQSNATIAPGDSGGPLVNAAGQVIGMITAGQSSGRNASTTIGFAIPSNAALAIVNQIRAGLSSPQVILGQVGYLGVTVTDRTSGAVVIAVGPGSPAEQAGLTANSVITDVAGTPISSSADLGNALHSHQPGDQVQVTWTDPAGASQSALVTLTTGPAI